MSQRLPKVSIMIPTYNQENYILQAVESVLMQDYENIEIIIADDCSNDSTHEIIKKYLDDKRVKYIRNKTNLGRVGNYHNTLYNHTTGDWILNLDGDDYYIDKTFISRAIKTIISYPNVVCYFGNKHFPQKLFNKKYNNYKISNNAFFMPGKLYFQNFNSIGSFAHMASLYRRDVAIEDQLCYTYNGIQSDFHGIIRLSLYGNVILAIEKGYHWREHNNNATNNFKDFKLKYKQGRECQYKIIEDIIDKLTCEEKEKWLKEGKQKVKLTYIKDNLRFIHNFHSLKIGLQNFNLNFGYIILYIKAILITIFKINMF